MSRLAPIGRRRSLLLAAVGLCLAAPALAAAPPKQSVRAQLAPVAPVKSGSGTFRATGASGKTVTVTWQLSTSNLSGKVTKATLQTPAPRKLVFALCQPCSAKASGRLVVLGTMWTRIRAGGGTVVVTTKAHPRGELRGPVKRA